MSDYDAAALAADLFGLFEAGGWTAVVAANEASPENEAKRLDLRAQRDALTTRIAAEFARLTAERDGWAAQSEANREWVDDLGRKLRDLEAERDAANERAAEYAQDIRDHKAAALHYRRLVMKQRRGERVEVLREDLDGLLSDQQFDLRHWRLEAEQATQKRCDLERDLREANERAGRLEGLLRDLEWVHQGNNCSPSCPACDEHEEHASDCWLAKAIALAPADAPGEEVR